eukprot:TRINITY_DN739_c0_g1_i1.p2 TRINITY_DN739_c0_g1~~TRINITY_DN739_c0_g1_i1.p2  ORF type:complete len:384 (+),score=183.27 TRINITY_DN739_c0_g1_i1:314-1465(+)
MAGSDASVSSGEATKVTVTKETKETKETAPKKHPMHLVKKRMYQATARHSTTVTDGALQEKKQQLQRVEATLKKCTASIDAVGDAWRNVFLAQRDFGESFLNGYPDKDDVHETAGETSASSTAAYKAFLQRKEGNPSFLTVEEKVVNAYLAEVAQAWELCKETDAAKMECDRYASKVEKMEAPKKKFGCFGGDTADVPEVSPVKKAKNHEKKEEARVKYDASLAASLQTLRVLYSKRAPVLQAAFVSFWLAQGKMASLLAEHDANAVSYANALEERVLEIDINTLAAPAPEEAPTETPTPEAAAPPAAETEEVTVVASTAAPEVVGATEAPATAEATPTLTADDLPSVPTETPGLPKTLPSVPSEEPTPARLAGKPTATPIAA